MDAKNNADPAFTGCLVCGKPIVYDRTARHRKCHICGRSFRASSACELGHYVCDDCHAAGSIAFFVPTLLASGERDPMKLFETVIALPGVHMHGPEHHAIVPCVLLTAYHNCTGRQGLAQSLKEAVRRARGVPGGTCGDWGVCGAAAGAGIFASIVTDSDPLNAEAWARPQSLTAQCLEKIAQYGGPRCCKRTGRIAIETAAAFSAKRLGVTMPLSDTVCEYYKHNRECLHGRCPYFPAEGV